MKKIISHDKTGNDSRVKYTDKDGIVWTETRRVDSLKPICKEDGLDGVSVPGSQRY